MSDFDDENGMHLILWRHAEAEDGFPDAQRPLTARGRKQAQRMATWLSQHLPQDAQILVSPAVRTQQTAAALGRPFHTRKEISVGADAAQVLAAAGWPDGSGRTVVVVGHQPTLGQVAARLLSGVEAYWSVKKGAVWWLSSRLRAGETQIVLRASISPDLLPDVRG